MSINGIDFVCTVCNKPFVIDDEVIAASSTIRRASRSARTATILRHLRDVAKSRALGPHPGSAGRLRGSVPEVQLGR